MTAKKIPAATEQSSATQEPVAHINQNGVIHEAGYEWGPTNTLTPLYTHPQPKAEQEPFAWCIESEDSADWCFAGTKEGVELNAVLMDDCVKTAPFPLYTHPQPKAEQAPVVHGRLKKAMQKIESAMSCHPNAVQTLIGEAWDELNEAINTHPQPKAEQGQHLSSHTDQYWLHEINNALAEGYTKGRASAKAEQAPKREPLTRSVVREKARLNMQEGRSYRGCWDYLNEMMAQVCESYYVAGFRSGEAAHGIKGEA